MFAKISLFTILSLALLGIGSNVEAATNYDSKTSENLKTSAKSFPPGPYKITNLSTGQSLKFTHSESSSDTIQNIFPSPDGDYTTVKLKQHEGSNYMRLSVQTDDGKDLEYCISAQWGTGNKGDDSGDGVDHAGVLYNCVVDPDDNSSSLEKPKQHWLLVPSDSSSSSSKRRLAEGENAHGKNLKHRRGSGKSYFIVPVDHIDDMQPLALVGKKVSSAGGAVGISLEPLDKSDSTQEWTFTQS